ncbi:PVC-type heme-binding CxxCH protein, partial [Fodinibius sp.]|uniref:PVC-type heme-binding CxxCH protein n=1 Tax=Fodinibius sp. TaxID=1872440 RepID=UPI003566A8E1
LNGGEVYSPLHPDRPPVTFTASDVRFHPDTYEVEVVGGKSQFGHTFDSYGRRFGTWNRAPVEHIVFDPSDLNRNPHLSFNETVNEVSKTGGEAVVFPISDAATSADFIPDLMGQSHSGTFTAASGVFVYKGSGLTPEHRGDVFIAESAQNLVQRQKMSPDGVSFSSELVYEGKEFLASEDEWFRPVFHGVGPADGLHVVDMHRKVIDHPAYVPERVRGKMDFQAGNDMGRIYRILSEDKSSSLADRQWVDEATPVTRITEWLTSERQWDRQTAHRLLLERSDSTVIPTLKTIAMESAQPESRVRALWLLHKLEGLDPGILRQAMADGEAGVRENAVALSRGMLMQSEDLQEAVTGACGDPDMRVRFQCALVLGDAEGPDVLEALASLAVADGEDRWIRAAILSGVGERMGAFLQHLQSQQPADSDSYAHVMEDLAGVLGNGGSKKELRRLVETTLQANEGSGWRFSAMLGLMEGLASRRDFDQSSSELLNYVYGADVPAEAEGSWQDFVEEVTTMAETDRENRVTVIDLMGFIGSEEQLPVFARALQPENPRAVQLAVVRAIGRQNTGEGARLLMDEERWDGYTPNVRSAILSQMLSTPTFVDALLGAIEDDVVAPAEISSVDRQRLMNNEDEEIQQRAETLFAELEGGARKEVYEEYLSAINTIDGDPEAGAQVFDRACSSCHAYEGEGGNVGPDLTDIKNQPPDAILLHTIMPNYEVYPSYQTVVIETNNGRSISGWIVSESDNNVTLRQASGADETVMRDNIASLSNTGSSMMPDGLEQSMSKEEMAGLIQYLKSGAEF